MWSRQLEGLCGIVACRGELVLDIDLACVKLADGSFLGQGWWASAEYLGGYLYTVPGLRTRYMEQLVTPVRFNFTNARMVCQAVMAFSLGRGVELLRINSSEVYVKTAKFSLRAPEVMGMSVLR